MFEKFLQKFKIFSQPYREYVLIAVLIIVLLFHYVFDGGQTPVLIVALLGSIIPLRDALDALRQRKITIEAFNFFALIVSFATGEYTSAAFIALMLAIASWLDWRTESRATNAVEELLKLKPAKATRETEDGEETIDAAEIREGDTLIVKNGDRIPADGSIIFGTAYINESSLTGESLPIEKTLGDNVFSSTISESGVIKMRVTKVGKDSTLERMAKLIDDALKNKSKAERVADRFAGIFLPVVLLGGVVTYFVTGSLSMTAALFLVVCADDIAVSIPLAVTAALGRAAKRGVIIKGGEWLHTLAHINIIAFDKTGTLTHGTFALAHVEIEPAVNETHFWSMVAMAEKFSEHPIGKALYREALKHLGNEPEDPTEVKVMKGVGIWIRGGGHEIAIGNDKLAETMQYELPEEAHTRFHDNERSAQTVMVVFLDGAFAGILGVADTLKSEATDALRDLRKKGVRLVMLTGDNAEVAKAVSAELGIDEYRAEMTPESKMLAIEELAKKGRLAMVGDGINDAPSLARADVGIAMGEGGTAVAVETADVVILSDRIDRIGEMIDLSRRTISVVNADIAIWVVTNIIGVTLVLTGIAGPAAAAFYNLFTDFFPILNSMRLFSGVRRKRRHVN